MQLFDIFVDAAKTFSRGRRHRRGRDSSSSSSSSDRDSRSGRRRSSGRRSPRPPPVPPRKPSSKSSESGETYGSSKVVMASVDSNSMSRDHSVVKSSDLDIVVKPSTSAHYVNMVGENKGSDPAFQPPAVGKVLATENLKVKKLSGAERIALAYKYDPTIEAPPPVKKSDRSTKLRGSDEEAEDAETVRIKNPTTFPPSDFVIEEWFEYSKQIHKNSKPVTVFAPPEDQTEGQGQLKDGKGTYKKVVNNSLKEPPSKLRWTFEHHGRVWADHVALDRDITLITKKSKDSKEKDPKEYQMSLLMCKKEWQHIQLAQSYILQAASHASYYLHSSRQAINQVLQTLDIVKDEPSVEALRDVKAMLKGVGYGVENVCKMAVYTHGGVTMLQREQFMDKECVYLPPEVKGNLLGQSVGGHELYNDHLDQVLEDIRNNRKEYHEKKVQDALVSTLQDKDDSGKRKSGQNSQHTQKTSVPDPFPHQKKPSYNDTKGGQAKKKWWNNNRGNKNKNQNPNFRGNKNQQPHQGNATDQQPKNPATANTK